MAGTQKAERRSVGGWRRRRREGRREDYLGTITEGPSGSAGGELDAKSALSGTQGRNDDDDDGGRCRRGDGQSWSLQRYVQCVVEGVQVFVPQLLVLSRGAGGAVLGAQCSVLSAARSQAGGGAVGEWRDGGALSRIQRHNDDAGAQRYRTRAMLTGCYCYCDCYCVCSHRSYYNSRGAWERLRAAAQRGSGRVLAAGAMSARLRPLARPLDAVSRSWQKDARESPQTQSCDFNKHTPRPSNAPAPAPATRASLTQHLQTLCLSPPLFRRLLWCTIPNRQPDARLPTDKRELRTSLQPSNNLLLYFIPHHFHAQAKLRRAVPETSLAFPQTVPQGLSYITTAPIPSVSTSQPAIHAAVYTPETTYWTPYLHKSSSPTPTSNQSILNRHTLLLFPTTTHSENSLFAH